MSLHFDGLEWFHEAEHGRIFHGDSFHLLSNLRASSVDLIVTSPPFGLVREKDYGNVQADEYLDWFRPFATHLHRVLKKTGSLVIDIGGTWNKGLPTRHLYHFKLLIMLCEEFDFHLAQDFYWWNPAKLPTPAEWVTIRRIRVKDALNKVWWLSKTPWPKASNRRVLQPYSSSMKELLENGYKPNVRPSGHDISNQFSTDNGAAIGLASDVQARLREVNRHIPVELLGQRWILIHTKLWPSSDMAYRMEQRVLEILVVERTVYERVQCPQPIVEEAWQRALNEMVDEANNLMITDG